MIYDEEFCEGIQSGREVCVSTGFERGEDENFRIKDAMVFRTEREKELAAEDQARRENAKLLGKEIGNQPRGRQS